MLTITLTEDEAITCFNALSHGSISLQTCCDMAQSEVLSYIITEEVRIIFAIQDKLKDALGSNNQIGGCSHGK